MIISTINGSPKSKDSNTEKYLYCVTKQLESNHTIKNYSVSRSPLSKEAVDEILHSDILLLGFPLYVDGIPVNLLSQMIVLERAFNEQSHADTIVYVIVNNGFYEGEQNINAIEMVKHFCKRAHIQFGMGIGIGAGEMQGGMISQGVPLGKAVLTNLGRKLNVMVNYIQERKSASEFYVRPNFPWRGFQYMADHTFWKAKAKSNGIPVKGLKKRLELQIR